MDMMIRIVIAPLRETTTELTFLISEAFWLTADTLSMANNLVDISSIFLLE